MGETGPSPLMLELRDVTVVRDGRTLLDSVTLTVAAGENTAIIGPNGSGKSTLIKVIAGQIYPSRGRGREPVAKLLGRDRWNLVDLRRHLGVVSADYRQRFIVGSSLGRVTGEDAVVASFFGAEVIFLHHEVPPALRERARTALTRVGAAHLGGRKLHEMSTGEAARVLLARALVHEPEVLVLDEPTSGLDLVAKREFLGMLSALCRRGTTLMLVTHHVDEIIPEIQRAVVMKGGRIVANGRPESVLNSAVLSDAYDAPVELERRGGWYELKVTGTDNSNG